MEVGDRGTDLFVITVGFSLPTGPTVLSIHRLWPRLAPRSPSRPVFMSLRRGQYFSVEPSHRDPLYKTLTKNRRSNLCPAPSPPPRLPHACPQHSCTQLQFAGRQACQIGRISQLWGPGELLSSPGVLKQKKRRQLAAFRADRAIKAKLQDRERARKRREGKRARGRERERDFKCTFGDSCIFEEGEPLKLQLAVWIYFRL